MFILNQDFSPNDGGFYKILAKNESGQSHANIHLNVLNNDIPSFKEKPKDQVKINLNIFFQLNI